MLVAKKEERRRERDWKIGREIKGREKDRGREEGEREREMGSLCE